MAMRNPFRIWTDNTREAWDYVFEISPAHPSRDEMHELRYTYDEIGADACRSLLELQGTSKTDLKKRDLYQQLYSTAHQDLAAQRLRNNIQTVPDWVDWDQIARGQDCFYRYGISNILGLAFQSLVAGMGAARIVETLYRTGGFEPKVARRRLLETTQFVLQCTKSIDSIKPGGEGFAAGVRVRLLHAAVRHNIMRLAKQDPTYYDTRQLGIPINDLDAIATITSFCTTLVHIALPRQGIWMRPGEVEDFTALWRYIAWIMGAPTAPFESPEVAKRWMEVILLYEVEPSQVSRLLARNVITSLQDQPPSYTPKQRLEAYARWLIGSKLADKLDFPSPSIYFWCVMASQFLLVMVITYASRLSPTLESRRVKKLRRIFWHNIVESKDGLGGIALYYFKHVPDLALRPLESEQTPPKAQRRLDSLKTWRFLALPCLAMSLVCALTYARPWLSAMTLI